MTRKRLEREKLVPCFTLVAKREVLYKLRLWLGSKIQGSQNNNCDDIPQYELQGIDQEAPGTAICLSDDSAAKTD